MFPGAGCTSPSLEFFDTRSPGVGVFEQAPSDLVVEGVQPISRDTSDEIELLVRGIRLAYPTDSGNHGEPCLADSAVAEPLGQNSTYCRPQLSMARRRWAHRNHVSTSQFSCGRHRTLAKLERDPPNTGIVRRSSLRGGGALRAARLFRLVFGHSWSRVPSSAANRHPVVLRRLFAMRWRWRVGSLSRPAGPLPPAVPFGASSHWPRRGPIASNRVSCVKIGPLGRPSNMTVMTSRRCSYFTCFHSVETRQ